MDEFAKTIHQGSDETRILPPDQLCVLGFGHDEIVGVTLSGESLSIKRIRAYQLKSCPHVILNESELGGSCQLCINEAVAAGDTLAHWNCLVCSKCVRSCSVPGCPNQVLCAPRHAIGVPVNNGSVENRSHDLVWLCLPHFNEYLRRANALKREHAYGILPGKTLNFINSCLVDPSRFQNERL